ncbi:uncharacterized protein LOC111631181 [Centruroides sculpturatus]|uniref:uncharacterized protein LOC111631181 n=1 Tax=Centruroides sculpturatus TaxID=218467 RepID=UPI000C6CCBE2|nr:uncharacterized protein LOC111631181 [Centruroides sculpturatus]
MLCPKTRCPVAEQYDFWVGLDEHLQTFAPEDYVLIDGNLSGYVGSSKQGYALCHRGHGLGKRNVDGCRILDCAEAHDFAIANTFFIKRLTHLATYISVHHATQVAYWLIKRYDLNLDINAKVIPSNNIGPQHLPLILDFRITQSRKSKAKITGPKRINISY